LATAKKADPIDIYYNNGHAGVPDPHYHIALVTNANMEKLGLCRLSQLFDLHTWGTSL
jgi:hypothetical protein